MVLTDFSCTFGDSKVTISTLHPNKQTLYKGPMLNNLFFLNIEFLPGPFYRKTRIPPSNNFFKPSTMLLSEPFAIIEDEFINFAKVPVNANL